jgi:hypothetical protein
MPNIGDLASNVAEVGRCERTARASLRGLQPFAARAEHRVALPCGAGLHGGNPVFERGAFLARDAFALGL